MDSFWSQHPGPTLVAGVLFYIEHIIVNWGKGMALLCRSCNLIVGKSYILHRDSFVKNMPELGNYEWELRSWIKYLKN